MASADVTVDVFARVCAARTVNGHIHPKGACFLWIDVMRSVFRDRLWRDVNAELILEAESGGQSRDCRDR